MSAPGSGPDIEELVKRITSQSGVRGFIILNGEGIPIRHSFTEASKDLAVHYAALYQSLSIKTKEVVHELDSNDDLSVIRLRTTKHEVIIAPDSKYVLIVIQEPDGYEVAPVAEKA